jgi:hypothetical protein
VDRRHPRPTAWAHAPRLVIRAPEKRCGKSRLLDVIEALCFNPFITVNSSPAAVYRSITDDPPTMLVDEADTIFGPEAEANEDLRGLLNAGHQRNRPAKRYDAAASIAWSRSRPSPWPRSPGSAPCPTPSKTAPSSCACAGAPMARRSPPNGTSATAPLSVRWLYSSTGGCVPISKRWNRRSLLCPSRTAPPTRGSP